MSALRNAFRPFEKDDWRALGNLTCCVLGLGSLGMGRSFAAAGPYYCCVALVLMAIVNIYSTSALTIVMRRCPPSVKTFGDIGEHIAGPWGRFIVVFTQFGSCIFTPVAFLVLGGSIILPKIFHKILGTADPNIYIPAMAILILPVVLIRSLKEGAWVAVIGFLGAFFGDFAAVVDSWMHSTHFSNTPIELEPTNIVSVFGTFSLAYGAAVVVPAIQRDHSKPENLPRVIAVGLGLITVIYFIIGLLAYTQYGCVSPSNLLLSMTNEYMEVFGLAMFFVHIAIGYAVLVNPALYLFERYLFGFDKADEDEEPATKADVVASLEQGNASQFKKLASPVVQSFTDTTWTVAERLKSYALRTCVVGVQVFIAMLLQGCFEPLSDFIGATSITLSCITIPVYMYWHMARKEMPMWEQAWIWFIIVVCTVLGFWGAFRNVEQMLEKVLNAKLFYTEMKFADGIQPLTARNKTCAVPISSFVQDHNAINITQYF